MSRYRAEIAVWPHSTGRGRDVDQKEAGGPTHTVVVEADDMRRALEKVELFRDGIETGPMVWMAPIQKMEKIDG